MDFSTSAHGLVSKGPNTGNFLKDDGSWAAAGGGPSQASQAALESETYEDTYPPPDLIKHHPGIAEMWCSWDGTGTIAINQSYNVTSISNLGTGNYRITIATDFSDINYCASMGCHDTLVSAQRAWMNGGESGDVAVGVVEFYTGSDDATTSVPVVGDMKHCYVAKFGDQ